MSWLLVTFVQCQPGETAASLRPCVGTKQQIDGWRISYIINSVVPSMFLISAHFDEVKKKQFSSFSSSTVTIQYDSFTRS